MVFLGIIIIGILFFKEAKRVGTANEQTNKMALRPAPSPTIPGPSVP